MTAISIITATFNSEKYIRATYESICAQTFCDWSWCVTDDCSTDSTWSILTELASQDERVAIYRNDSNLGAAVSRNNSIDNAVGVYLAFLDSDDLWEPQKLSKQYNFMEKGYDFSFSGYSICLDDGTMTGKKVDMSAPVAINYDDLLVKRVTLGCSTVMLRKSYVAKQRMPLIRTGQDYAFWLLLLREAGGRAYQIAEALTKYRIAPGSISRNKYLKAKRQWQIYRSLEKLTVSKSAWCFLCYALRAVFRR